MKKQLENKKIVILASGNGSNFEAIVNHIRKQSLQIEVESLITDNPRAFAIERAKRLGVPVKVIDYKSFPSRDEFNRALFDLLKEQDPDLIVLAGFMKILPPEIVRFFWRKIVNIHPSLLPAFPGLHAIEKAFKYGVKVTGVTVHFVDEGVDTGPIILQECVKVDDSDTLETLEEKIHAVEHKIYIEAIKKVLFGD